MFYQYLYMNNYNTNNYNINYIKNDNKDIKTTIILELYRLTLYNKLQEKLKKIRIKYTNNNNDKNKSLTNMLALDILSILLFNHKYESNLDPLFDSKSPFTKLNINNYFKKYKCIRNISKDTLNIIIKIFPKISNKYIKYYNKIIKFLKKKSNFNKIDYEINQSNIILKNKNFININLTLINNTKIKIFYNNKILISSDIFNHLNKLYTIENNTNDYLLEYIYIVFNRYFIFSSGNNQSSILPSLKKILKEKLNIKIELFGSPLNTMSIKFGSFFYDIDNKFGSIGNYFNTKIIKGYYEINPPFDICLINNIFKKSLKELKEANTNNQPLLFFFIIPKSYFNYKNLHKDYDLFIKYKIMIEKNNFLYRRYNRSYDIMNTNPIVDTFLILCCTDHINHFVNYNISIFDSIIKDWLKKIEIYKN